MAELINNELQVKYKLGDEEKTITFGDNHIDLLKALVERLKEGGGSAAAAADTALPAASAPALPAASAPALPAAAAAASSSDAWTDEQNEDKKEFEELKNTLKQLLQPSQLGGGTYLTPLDGKVGAAIINDTNKYHLVIGRRRNVKSRSFSGRLKKDFESNILVINKITKADEITNLMSTLITQFMINKDDSITKEVVKDNLKSLVNQSIDELTLTMDINKIDSTGMLRTNTGWIMDINNGKQINDIHVPMAWDHVLKLDGNSVLDYNSNEMVSDKDMFYLIKEDFKVNVLRNETTIDENEEQTSAVFADIINMDNKKIVSELDPSDKQNTIIINNTSGLADIDNMKSIAQAVIDFPFLIHNASVQKEEEGAVAMQKLFRAKQARTMVKEMNTKKEGEANAANAAEAGDLLKINEKIKRALDEVNNNARPQNDNKWDDNDAATHLANIEKKIGDIKTTVQANMKSESYKIDFNTKFDEIAEGYIKPNRTSVVDSDFDEQKDIIENGIQLTIRDIKMLTNAKVQNCPDLAVIDGDINVRASSNDKDPHYVTGLNIPKFKNITGIDALKNEKKRQSDDLTREFKQLYEEVKQLCNNREVVNSKELLDALQFKTDMDKMFEENQNPSGKRGDHNAFKNALLDKIREGDNELLILIRNMKPEILEKPNIIVAGSDDLNNKMVKDIDDIISRINQIQGLYNSTKMEEVRDSLQYIATKFFCLAKDINKKLRDSYTNIKTEAKEGQKNLNTLFEAQKDNIIPGKILKKDRSGNHVLLKDMLKEDYMKPKWDFYEEIYTDPDKLSRIYKEGCHFNAFKNTAISDDHLVAGWFTNVTDNDWLETGKNDALLTSGTAGENQATYYTTYDNFEKQTNNLSSLKRLCKVAIDTLREQRTKALDENQKSKYFINIATWNGIFKEITKLLNECKKATGWKKYEIPILFGDPALIKMIFEMAKHTKKPTAEDDGSIRLEDRNIQYSAQDNENYQAAFSKRTAPQRFLGRRRTNTRITDMERQAAGSRQFSFKNKKRKGGRRKRGRHGYSLKRKGSKKKSRRDSRRK